MSEFTVIILTLWFSILLRVYYKSSLTSTVRNFSLFYLFILFLTSTTRHVSAHPQAIIYYYYYIIIYLIRRLRNSAMLAIYTLA
jgi:hypothetical protein